MSDKSLAEDRLAEVLADNGIYAVRQYFFHPKRKWRADFYIPIYRILVEVEGGVFVRGRHTRGIGYTKDIEKYNEAAILGFMVIRATTEMVMSGKVFDYINRAIEYKQHENS